jgi:transposase-like protein
MQDGPRRQRRQLSPEEKWQVFLEVTSQQLTQADAARKWGVDVST